MNVLVGSTGFVGGVLAKHIKFDMQFNSKSMPDYIEVNDGCDLYLCCLPAQKWVVNSDPLQDMKNMVSIFEMISKKSYKRVVLISTIDVYSESPLGSNESFIPSFSKLGYGSNRHIFELMVSDLKYESLSIFRLPALFGHGMRKNILYDLLNNNCVDKINYNSSFQWYDMSKLHDDIESRMDVGGIFNMFSEPVDTVQICEDILGVKVVLVGNKTLYDYKTKQNSTGYLMDKIEVLGRIRKYCDEFKHQQSRLASQ